MFGTRAQQSGDRINLASYGYKFMLPFPPTSQKRLFNQPKRASSVIPESLRKVPNGFDVVSAGGGRRNGEGDRNRCTETERSTTGKGKVCEYRVKDDL